MIYKPITVFLVKKLTLVNFLVYKLFLLLYSVGIRIAALWNIKAKQWVKGREEFPKTLKSSGKQTVWMHCASLGEFEQGRPVLEKLKNENSNISIVLTFFSPSGYEITKNYSGADYIFYLPMDSKSNAKKLLDVINPTLVLWVKYEYWHFYLAEIKKRNIPLLLVSGIFLPYQPFFKWYGSHWKNMLKNFSHLFVQNEASKDALAQIGYTNNITISGDTRFDRVITIAEKFEPIELVEKFCADKKVIVAGSTWEEDEAELIHYVRVNPDIKFIIAPHSIDSENLKEIKSEFANSIFYSEALNATSEIILSKNVLIINNIGMLSRLYKYGTICYVGGAFTDNGVHNVLEAAVYGKPVIYGPEYEKYLEAIELIDNGGAISINNALELEIEFNKLLTDETALKNAEIVAREYVYSRAGATEKIVNYIYEKRLLTN